MRSMVSKSPRRVAGIAALAIALLAGVQTPEAAAHDAGLDFGQPIKVWDGTTGAHAGVARALIPGDFDGDGAADVVMLTVSGIQVLRNTHPFPGMPTFALSQEFDAPWAWGGVTDDWDCDGDLDVIVADAERVLLLRNDGTGTFALQPLLAHGFGVSTTVATFRLGGGEDKRRGLVVSPAATDYVVGDHLGFNPGRHSLGYILVESCTGGFEVAGTLPAAQADAVRVMQLGADARVFVANRDQLSYYPLTTAYVGDMCWASPLVTEDTAAWWAGIDDSALIFGFGYNVDISADGAVGFGSWNRSSVVPGGFAPTLIDVPVGAAFVPDEIAGFRFGDMDGDGLDDAVMVGRDTGLIVATLDGDPTDPMHRFVGDDIPGETTCLAVANFDGDRAHMPDALVGGDCGLWFIGNNSVIIPHDAHTNLLFALRCLEDVLDPERETPLATTDARDAASDAIGDLYALDPIFITVGDVAVPRLTALRAYRHHAQLAYERIGDALDALSDGEREMFGAKLCRVQDALLSAVIDLDWQILEQLGMHPKMAKRGGISKADRLMTQARVYVSNAQSLATLAFGSSNFDDRRDLRDEAFRAAVKGLDLGLSAAKLSAKKPGRKPR
ncbi:MAG: hypothetical protein K8T90_02630 [Planctomycetes bacterium]|nr:hypothetical protein [Planctomycetota bacterium]